jgi:hypothetical protein
MRVIRILWMHLGASLDLDFRGKSGYKADGMLLYGSPVYSTVFSLAVKLCG